MRLLLLVGVLYGCTACSDETARCDREDSLVGTWARPQVGDTWRIGEDCTWSLVGARANEGGTWSSAGAQAIFAPAEGTPPMTVTPVLSGDRLVLAEVTGAQLLSATAVYPLVSGGPGLSDTAWGKDTRTSGQGGSCSFVEFSFRMTLAADGTAVSRMRTACQPANMPYIASMTGTWTAIDSGAAFTAQLTNDRIPTIVETQTWARFGDTITDGFFVRAP